MSGWVTKKIPNYWIKTISSRKVGMFKLTVSQSSANGRWWLDWDLETYVFLDKAQTLKGAQLEAEEIVAQELHDALAEI